MMLARVCRAPLIPQIKSLYKVPVVNKQQFSKIQVVRLFASDGRTAFARTARRQTAITEPVVAPEAAFKIGQGAVAGAAALGLGALCFYGLGLSSSAGAIDRAAIWPQYVKDRIHTTYMYFGTSIAASALSAAACVRSPAVMRLVTRQGWLAAIGTMALMIGTGAVTQSLPYHEGFGMKQAAWLLNSAVIGAVLAPLYAYGGSLVLRAAWYTAGVVGGLSTVAACAPSEKFLNMGGPLAIGLGVVFCSSIGTYFLPPTSAFGAGMYSMAMYGGLILFSMYILYDTQRIIKQAETRPNLKYSGIETYDPINNAYSIYINTINIFIRIFHILSMSGRQK